MAAVIAATADIVGPADDAADHRRMIPTDMGDPRSAEGKVGIAVGGDE